MMTEDNGTRLPMSAAVLAGGQSARMGADKTLLPVGGTPLITRVLDVVGSICEEAFVVTNRPEALADTPIPADVNVLTDEIPFQGPLGGLVTALATAEHEWLLAVAADLPWLRPEVVRALWNARDGVQVVVPVSDKGTEPLLALYHVSCLDAARESLDTGRRRLVAFFPKVSVAEIPLDALRSVDPDLESLININTPEDLMRARDNIPAEEGPVRPTVLSAPAVEQGLPSERPVTLFFGETEVATVQASPCHLDDLAVGFMVTEGLLTDPESLEGVSVDEERGLVWVRTAESLPDDFAQRRRYITAGCGKGVTFASAGHMEGLHEVGPGPVLGSDALYALMGQLARGADCYRDTGGTHACGIARDGQIFSIREDVGRHNALDKLLGRVWMEGIDASGTVVVTTGRVSYEMAVKAAKTGVPIVVSRTAVTDLAVRVAQHTGVTLVGYARGGRMVVYTHPERVRMEEDTT